MSNAKFNSLITKAGMERFAAAALSGEQVGFHFMAVGDGAGMLPAPDISQTGLINEVYRSLINAVKVTDIAANVIEAEMIMPPQAGGFMMREVGLFSEDGICLAVGNMPETYKPLLMEGAGRFSIIRIQLAVSNTALVQLITAPSVIVATQADIIAAGSGARDYTDENLSNHEKSRNHPDATTSEKGFVKLSSKIDSDSQIMAATPAAVKAAIAYAIRAAWDQDNPVGTARFYAKNINPNEIYPWSTWIYTGENKSIRVGKADGSNVGQTSGNDTVTIARANLPAEKLSVSGKAESAELNNKETTQAGGTEFNVYRFGADNRENSKGRFSLDDVEMGDIPIPVKIEPHTHKISLTVPERTVSGETVALGEGKAISIVEAHTLLMCWARTA